MGGIKYLKIKVEKCIQGVERERERGAAERKKIDPDHLSPHLSFGLWLVLWPSPYLYTS